MKTVLLTDAAPLVSDRVQPFIGERPYIATGNLDDNGKFSPEMVTYENRPSRADINILPGDICMARMQGTVKVFLLGINHSNLILSTGFAVFRPITEQLDSRYLYHYLRTSYLQKQKDSMCTGATQKAITNDNLSKLKITLPSLLEQRRIAEILEKADALRAKRQAALEQINMLAQSIFLEMFGDPSTNPKGWERTILYDLCDKVIDCPHSTPEYANLKTPYFCLRSSDIQNDYLDLSHTNCVEKSQYEARIKRGKPTRGDIVYCREGARFGNAARILGNSEICLGQRMMLFRPKNNKSTTEFLWAYLSSVAGYNQAKRLVEGSASPHINIKEIVLFSIPTPPINLQKEFSCCVNVIDSLIKSNELSFKKLDELFVSLQYHAFRGEL